MNKFERVSQILDETMNCAAGVTGIESLPARSKNYKVKKNYDKALKGIVSNKKNK